MLAKLVVTKCIIQLSCCAFVSTVWDHISCFILRPNPLLTLGLLCAEELQIFFTHNLFSSIQHTLIEYPQVTVLAT